MACNKLMDVICATFLLIPSISDLMIFSLVFGFHEMMIFKAQNWK